MSGEFGFWIHYAVPFSQESVRKVIDSLREGVADNWATYHDEWSGPQASIAVDLWIEKADPSRMHKVLDDWKMLTTEAQYLSFSPLSAWVGDFRISKWDDETLAVSLRVCERVTIERQGSREVNQMELEWERIRKERGEPEPWKTGPDEEDPTWYEWWQRHTYLSEETQPVWPQNKKCLQHIIEKLRAALPVQSVQVDEQLQDEQQPPESPNQVSPG